MSRHRSALPTPLRTSLHRVLALAALLVLAPAGQADEAQLAERVRELLTQEAAGPGREVRVEVHPAAAQLPPCPDPQPFLPHARPQLPGRVAVGIRCTGAGTRYLQATVAISGDYPVTRSALEVGQVLSPELLEMRHGDLGSLPRNAILDAEQVLGHELTRRLPQGSALPANALRRMPLVERGARVRVEARAGGFVASREGTALDSGGAGELIRIRTESGSVIRARISDRNLLSVDF